MVILLFRPSELAQASFQLSFLAAAILAGIAAPLLERTAEPYHRALEHLGDVTRDGSYEPKAAELRLDLRAVSALAAVAVTCKSWGILRPTLWRFRAAWDCGCGNWPCFRTVLQIGMLPLMARDFNRVSFIAPVANIPAVLLTGIIVPLGFAALAVGAVWKGCGLLLGRALGFLIGMLAASIHWFAQLPSSSVRVPSPPTALLAGFFVAAIAVSAAILTSRKWAWRAGFARRARLGSPDRDLPVSGAISAGAAGSDRFGRGAGRFDFSLFPRRKDHAGGCRRAARRDLRRGMRAGARRGRGRGLAVPLEPRTEAHRYAGGDAWARRPSWGHAGGAAEFSGGRIVGGPRRGYGRFSEADCGSPAAKGSYSSSAPRRAFRVGGRARERALARFERSGAGAATTTRWCCGWRTAKIHSC